MLQETLATKTTTKVQEIKLSNIELLLQRDVLVSSSSASVAFVHTEHPSTRIEVPITGEPIKMKDTAYGKEPLSMLERLQQKDQEQKETTLETITREEVTST